MLIRNYNFHNIFNMGDLNSNEEIYKRNSDWSYEIGEDDYDFGDIDFPDEIDKHGFIYNNPGDYDFNKLISNLYNYPKKENMSEEDYRNMIINLRMQTSINYIIQCAYDSAVNLLGKDIRFEKSNMYNPIARYIQFQFIIDIPMNKVYVEWILNDRFKFILNNTNIPNKIVGVKEFDDHTKDGIRENLKENTNMWPSIILPDDDNTISYSQTTITPYTIGVYRSINDKYYSLNDKNKVKHHLNIRLDYNEVNRKKFYKAIKDIYTKYPNNNDLPKAFEEYKKVYKDITGITLNELITKTANYAIFGLEVRNGI